MTIADSRYPRPRPLLALARAEYLQFRRNKTLLFTALSFPVLFPLAIYLLGRGDGPDTGLVATTFEMFALFALVYVQFYSVLSMVTTRRSEGVLKRLRTGEASDLQILAAPVLPGFVITAVTSVLIAVVVYSTGAPAPVNVLALIVGLLGGAVVFGLLAITTSAFTKNAEAAQITSLPVIAFAMIGVGSIRAALPDKAGDLIGLTPFAAVSDLMHLGTSGRVATAPADSPATDFAGSFADMAGPVVTLAVWTAVAAALVYKFFRWDDRG